MTMNWRGREQELLHVAASAAISAGAADVYRLIADYHSGHPRIIPPEFFRNLRVEGGGYGAGTVITFDMIVLGRTRHTRALVSEPEPGRVLVESYPENGATTTFAVNSLGNGRSRVTISTALPVRTGVLGVIERRLTGRFLRGVFAAELTLIEREMQKRRSATVQTTTILSAPRP
jgi:hypothetical protein